MLAVTFILIKITLRKNYYERYSMEPKILKGNIIDAKVDAVVLPANTRLKEGSGASEAIFVAAGMKDLTKECNKIGYCEMGSAVPTLAYNLPAKFIIHAVVPA